MKCMYCEKEIVARGLCRAHYQQAIRDKNLGIYDTKSEAKSVKERLLEKCKVMPSGCWEWQAQRKKDKFAYGMFWLDGKFFLVPNKEVDNG